jgi:pimeloyl-ACP methyl ester carboxylesterase
MITSTRSSIKLTDGAKLSFVAAGDKRRPAVLLIHGFPSSANTFRDIIPTLADVAYVIAPDLPGYGNSDVLKEVTFDIYAAAVTELLDHLHVGERYIYLHDFGASVGFRVAMDNPKLVRGLIIQNANAHRTGFGPQWKDSIEYWSRPNSKNEAAAMSFLNLEGTRYQYVGGLPGDVAKKISPSVWEEDWRVMSLPGRLAVQRSLITDYGNYAKRFDAISKYLRKYQPPALMVWGRHDPFFDIDETLSWMKDLPRMEAHILDGGHFLLETHAAPAAAFMKDFIERINSSN